MGTRPGPEVTSNARIDRATLEQYFNSIQEPFRDTQKGLAEENSGWPVIFAVGFAFSLIPVIPYLLSQVVLRFFGPQVVSVRGIQLQLSSFFFWWLACFAIFLSLLVLAIKFSGPTNEEMKRRLSPQQMRFAYCYGVVDEIGKYRTNQLGRHIETARNYLGRVRQFDLDPLNNIRLREGLPLFISTVGRERPPKWYRLMPDTELILDALGTLTPKLGDRLNDRKDLGAIQSALTDLAGYFYTEIPELSDTSSQGYFEQAGMESLLKFARQIVELEPYQSEQVEQTPKERFSRKVVSAGYGLTKPFVHENVLVAFCAWYIVTLLLFCGGFYVAFHLVPTMKVDSTIATAIVGGPIATAVTAVTIPRLGKGR